MLVLSPEPNYPPARATSETTLTVGHTDIPAQPVVGTRSSESRPKQPRGRFVAALTGLAVVVGSVLSTATAGAAPSEPQTLQELEAAFAIGTVHADFVVVIDTSGSMGEGADPLYPKVRAAFGSLVDALPTGDRLSVVTFDSVPVVSFDGPITAANRGQAKQLPSRLGSHTDIGAALSSAVDRLDRADAAQVQTVIFITDGRPDPPVGSAFAAVGNAAWAAAKVRASGLESRRTVLVRALGLTDDGRVGAGLAAQVFSQPEVLRLPADQLREYLTGEVAKTRLRLLAKAVGDEISAGVVTAKVTKAGRLGQKLNADVVLSSSLAHLGVDIDLKSVVAKDAAGRVVRSAIVGGSRVVHLGPGANDSFQLQLKPDVKGSDFFEWPPPRREEIDVKLTFDAATSATPKQVLAQQLGVKTPVAVTSNDAFTIGRTVGKTWARLFLQLALLLAAAAVVLYVWWRWIKRPPLVGELVLVGPAADTQPPVRLRGKAMKVDATDFGRGAARTKVRLYPKRAKRNKVFAERLGLEGGFERRSGHRWVPAQTGSELGLGQYRIDQDGGPTFRWRFGQEGD
jgi:Mg-chelatase subunit ChlD